MSAAPRIPAGPDEQFLCEHYRCSMRGAVCVERQLKRELSRVRKRGGPEYVPPHLQFCAGGKCEQGAEIRARLAGVKAPPLRMVASPIHLRISPEFKTPKAPPPAAPTQEKTTMPPKSALTDMPDQQVWDALEKHGSVKATAIALGCSWATLDARIKKMNAARLASPSAPEKKPAAAPVVDVEAVLRARVTELRAELGVLSEKQKELTRLERALEALEAE